MKSRLQLSVMELYRNFLKFGKRFESQVKRQEFRAKVREHFEEHRHIPKRKFNAIEYKVRSGKNLLRSMEDGQVSRISSVDLDIK